MLIVVSEEQSSPMTISIGKFVCCSRTLSRALASHSDELNVVITTLTTGATESKVLWAGVTKNQSPSFASVNDGILCD